MPSKPKIQEKTIISIPNEKMEEKPEIIEVSYTQAKKLTKKPMTEGQKLNAERLVALNRVKWETKRIEKEALKKQEQEEQEKTHTKVYVKPKRIYPPRKTKAEIKEESEESDNNEPNSETDSSDDEIQYKKPPPPPPKIKVKHVEQKIQKIEEINKKIDDMKKYQPANNYADMLSRFWKMK
jgi:hypothetical protein